MSSGRGRVPVWMARSHVRVDHVPDVAPDGHRFLLGLAGTPAAMPNLVSARGAAPVATVQCAPLRLLVPLSVMRLR
jgi:phosphoribosylcarboxyaminoimidazole (NCAIR) mutase